MVFDIVLPQVYVYHEPPIPGVVRLPSHIMPMLLSDLQAYLAEKRLSNRVVTSWYHSLFSDVITERYQLADRDIWQRLHRTFSQLYTSCDGVYSTITLSKLRRPVTIENADRQVKSAPVPELQDRDLFNMAYHLSAAGDKG